MANFCYGRREHAPSPQKNKKGNGKKQYMTPNTATHAYPGVWAKRQPSALSPRISEAANAAALQLPSAPKAWPSDALPVAAARRDEGGHAVAAVLELAAYRLEPFEPFLVRRLQYLPRGSMRSAREQPLPFPR